MTMPQLPLSLTPPRRKRLDNFVTGANAPVVSSLRHGLEARGWVLLCGPEGSGKSHLALGVLAEWSSGHRRACYVPCRERGAAELLASGDAELAVVEDIEALAGRERAELGLFNALNRWRAARTAVLMTGSGATPFGLPDLASRVSQAARLTLKPLDDEGLSRLIRQLIVDFHVVPGRGLSDYLMRHGPRSAGSLVELFERISRRAQAERRVVSVPLAREALKNGLNEG
jgi:DnaA family protein